MQVIATRIRKDSSLANRKIKDIAQDLEGFPFRVVAIARELNTLIPGGDETLEPDDLVFILARRETIPTLMLVAELGARRRSRVMILGGGRIGSRIAELLQDSFKVTLLESDVARAEELSEQLGHVELLHGDAADSDTLLMAGLLKMDTVIAATGDNETNIMTSVLAKNLIKNQPGDLHGKESTAITFVKREKYLGIAAAMGNDIVLNRKILAGDQILKHLFRGEMLSAAHLNGVDAEVVELVAGHRAAITKRPLSGIRGLEDKIIIGGIFQDERWQTAIGSTVVREGDRVIGVCRSDALPELERLVLG
jgi:trk system potassium uptake protein TrkA